MNNDVETWLDGEGGEFLRRIGVAPGDRVLDFGCGSGHYTIPAALVVGETGRVHALDKEDNVLLELRRKITKHGLANIKTGRSSGDIQIDLPDESVDVILAYDVLHYFEEREELFAEFHRVLKKDGLLSVYPKHNKDDHPLSNLARLAVDDIIEEFERAGFELRKTIFERLIHDDDCIRGKVFNFSPERSADDDRNSG